MDSDHLTTYWEREEEENSRKGLIGSFCFHFILLLLFLLPWFKTADPPPGIPGVLVSMGNPDFLAEEEPSKQQSSEPLPYVNEDEEAEEEVEKEEVPEIEPIKEKQEEAKPTKPKTATVEKPVKEVPAKFEKTVADVQEESPVQIKEEKEKKQAEALEELERKKAESAQREKQKLEQEKVAQEQEARQQAEAAAEAKKVADAKRQKAEAAAKKKLEEQRKKQEAFEKTKNELGSLFGGDGESNESEGKKGDPDGSNDSDILEGLSGGLSAVGGGLSGRGIIYEPKIKENSQKTGKVVVKVCVDRSGSIISSKFTQRGSTTTDSELVEVAEKAAAKYKFTPGDLAEQCGTITIDFKLK